MTTETYEQEDWESFDEFEDRPEETLYYDTTDEDDDE